MIKIHLAAFLDFADFARDPITAGAAYVEVRSDRLVLRAGRREYGAMTLPDWQEPA